MVVLPPPPPQQQQQQHVSAVNARSYARRKTNEMNECLSLSSARQRCNYTARAPDHWRRRMRRSRVRTGRATMRMLRAIYKRASLTNLRTESFRSMPKINRDKLS